MDITNTKLLLTGLLLAGAIATTPTASAGGLSYPDVETDFFLSSVDIDWAAAGTITRVCYGGSGDEPFGDSDLDRRDCVAAGARGSLVSSLTRSASATETLFRTTTSNSVSGTVTTPITTMEVPTRTLSGTDTRTVTNGQGAIGPLIFTEAGEWPEAVYALFLLQQLGGFDSGGPVNVNCVALFEESFQQVGLQITSIIGAEDDLVYTNCPQLWQLYDDFGAFGCECA